MQQVCNLDNVYLSSNPIYFLGFAGLQISFIHLQNLGSKGSKIKKKVMEKLTTKAVSK